MSENSWQDKHYSDYFKSLEERLAKGEKNLIHRTGISKKTIVGKTKRKGVYKVFKLRKSVITVVLVLAIVLASVVAVFNKNANKKNKVNEQDKNETVNQLTTEPKKEEKIVYNFGDDTAEIPASNDAKSAIIIDLNTNNVVAARNPQVKAYPASTTKLMTLLVATEHLKDLSATFTMTLEITDPLFVAEASVAGFLNNEVITVKDLLYGTMLPSGADAATALAIMAGGDEKGFVELMNQKAAELGLTGTNFDNPTGLHSKQNYTTAYDMAVILGAVLKNDLCREIISTYQYRTSKTPQNPNGLLLSNTIFEYMYGTEPETATVLGGKTGYVNESGYCIASYGKCNENDNRYIVVTLGNSSRWPAFYGQIDLYKQFAK